MARSTGRPVRTVRAGRVIVTLTVIPNIYFGIVNFLAGQGVAFASFAAVVFVLGVVAFQTVVIRRMEAKSGQHYPLAEPVLRRIAHRPRRIMTPDDYKRLRELEAELGWEPSEPLVPAAGRPSRDATAPVAAPVPPSYCACAEPSLVEVRAPESAVPPAAYCGRCGRRARDHGRGEGRHPARPRRVDSVWSTSGTGRCTCPACQQSMREARGREAAAVAAEHFAQLARVGRNSCASWCPICAEREAREFREALSAERKAAVTVRTVAETTKAMIENIRREQQ
jgi:hypothetical protein